jgi:drug/metabolite transporter (DMT)-like permease
MLAVGLSLLAALGFGSSAIFARVGMQGIKPLPSTLIAAVATFPPILVLTLWFAWPDTRALPAVGFLWLLCLGALNFLGGRALNYLSIDLLGASRSSPFVGTSAVFAAIFAVTLTGEQPHPVVILGTALVFLGLGMATGGSMGQGWHIDRRSLLGYLSALGAGASYGGTNVLAKALTAMYGSPLMISFFSLMFGIILLCPLAAGGAIQGIRASREGSGFLVSVVLSGIASAVAVTSLFYALQRDDVVIVSPIASISPLITLLLAQLFLSRLEKVTGRLVAGTLLTVVGVAFVIVGSTL